MQKNKVIVIAGPTACGKSALAVDLAVELNGVIINADSVQLYKDIPILAACPSFEYKEKVPHFLYEIFDTEHLSSVTDWLSLAVKEIKKAFKKGQVPIVVGGTGFYLDNLINGTTPIPEIGLRVKNKVRKILEKGLKEAYEILGKVDQKSYKRLNVNDITRIRRALEVYYDTKIPISTWFEKPLKKAIEADFVVVKLMPEKKILDEKCQMRFDEMMKKEALLEVKKLLLRGVDMNVRAIGIQELSAFLQGSMPLETAVHLAKTHTKQYAKRQLTWFRNKLAADVVLEECYSGQKVMLKKILGVALKRLKG